MSGFEQFKNAVMESVLNEATEAFFANFKDTMKTLCKSHRTRAVKQI